MHPLTLVFDIDDTIALHFDQRTWEEKTREVANLYGREFVERNKIMACGYPHFIFPGMPELWRWLDSRGHRLAIFSSAVRDRNMEFTEGFLRLAFGERAAELLPIVRVLSREDCTCAEYKMEENAKRYQMPRFYGNYKKVLSGVLVPPSELPWTLLIDDDWSYMPRTEIPNHVHVLMDIHLRPVPDPGPNGLKDWFFSDFAYFYKAFYVAGFLDAVEKRIESRQSPTAAAAAKALQIDISEKPFGKDFCYSAHEDIGYYWKGERILREINPETEIPPRALDSGLNALMERAARERQLP